MAIEISPEEQKRDNKIWRARKELLRALKRAGWKLINAEQDGWNSEELTFYAGKGVYVRLLCDAHGGGTWGRTWVAVDGAVETAVKKHRQERGM